MKSHEIKLTDEQVKRIKMAIQEEIKRYDGWIKEAEGNSSDWLFEERKEWNDLLRYLADET